LAGGDLLLIDAGAELGFYASDVTRTFPVNGRFTAEQRALYDVVLGAQVAVIEASKPGATMSGLHELSLKHLTEGLVSLELIEGPVEKAIEEKTYEKFTVHKTGHFLGLDVHDCGSTWVGGKERPLAPGMIYTVEPGLYVGEKEESVDERWRGIGIRIEDDVLITEDGHEVLTPDIPKTVEDVEAACAG